MKKIKCFIMPVGLLFLFVIYAWMIGHIDTAAIGPFESEVGFATINGPIAAVLKFNSFFYLISKILLAAAFGVVGCFVLLGIVQLVKGKSFAKVDSGIYGMAGVYVCIALCYVFFEKIIINFRPIVFPGEGLEASFPSTHTMVTVAIFVSAALYFIAFLEKREIRKTLMIICLVMAAAMPIVRLLSGVHWLTDIVGGVILGITIACFYGAYLRLMKK